MRWFAELLDPSRKCARLGHRMQDRRVRVYLYPPEGVFRSRHVADRAVEVTPTCERCGHAETTRTEGREGLNGLTMESANWDRLRDKGRLAL